jgi:hypothetical protein
MLNLAIFFITLFNIALLFYFCFKSARPSLFIIFPVFILCFRTTDQNFQYSMLYLALAWYLVFLDSVFKNTLMDVQIVKQINWKSGRFLVFSCVLYAAVFLEGLGGVFGANKAGNASSFFNLYMSIYTVLYVFALILLVQMKLTRSQVIFFFTFIVIFGITINSRGLIAKGFLFALLIYLFSRNSAITILKRAIPFSILAVIPLFFVVIATLNRKGIAISAHELSVGFMFFVDQVQDVRGNLVNPEKIKYLREFVQFNSFRLDSMYFLAFLYGLVPSVFWVGKPAVSIGQPIGEQVFGSRVDAAGGGVPTDLIGQSIMTFGGDYGLLLGIILSILILTLIPMVFRYSKVGGLAIYVSFGSFFGSDFGRMFIDAVYFVPLFLMIYFLLNVKFKF